MLKDKLGIDDKDVRLFSLYIKNPDISQTELAKSLNISQPSINARVNKLKKKGILASTVGIEFNKSDLYLTRIDFTASNAENILNELKQCSFFVNGFIMSGKNNVSILIVGHDLKKIETIVNKHLRNNQFVKDINVNVVVSTTKPFVCGIDIEKEHHEECQNPASCDKCMFIKKGGVKTGF